MSSNATKTSENILGYVLTDRIGAGSYGEVWSADAPGGIRKAVKLIYGFHDENRAQNELKSLNRVKEVRHPFLLSLERIDIVDDRLVVITELADMSLKDRFRESCDDGNPGIPRDELIGYLRDAADALDHLSEVHSLQHLDIKPENLLLLGGHIKVADFGLVKEVMDTTQSLMGGLTPAYAPPELFDGRPNRASDQYSLAIVYAEMLTGVRPFPGTTAAQLAVQHMQGRPNLRGLSPGDQNIVSKALAKSPELRYPTCAAFVEELKTRQGRSKPQVRRRLNPAIKSDEESATVVVPQAPGVDGTMVMTTGTLLAPRTPADVVQLPPLDCDLSKATVNPTLFLGVGNTGTRILRRLHARVRTRLGDRSATPAIRFLCLDTDQRALIESTDDIGDDSFDCDDILAMPLRKPAEYREDANMHLSWLSRRWIYNIPRSLQTEGIRPLGRLAFVDHSEAYFKRLQEILTQATAPESLAATAEATGLLSNETPRVFLLTSISGGLGSGCIVDAAYGVRVAMAELGIPDDVITGILIHSTARYDRDAQLAIANAYACLSELKHCELLGYPGDESCNLPPFAESDGPFSSSYFVDLGSRLFEDDYEHAIDNVAEYVYQNSLSRASLFFEASRENKTDSEATIRTFGVSHVQFSRDDQITSVADSLTRLVVEDWLNLDPSTQRVDAEKFVSQAVTRLELSEQKLIERVNGIVAEHLEGEPKAHVLAAIQQALQQSALDTSSREATWKVVDETLQRLLGPRPALSDDTELKPIRMQMAIARSVEQFGEQMGASLANGVKHLIDHVDVRFGGAKLVNDRAVAQIRNIAEALATSRQRCSEKLTDLEEQVSTPRKKSQVTSDEGAFELQLPEMVELRLGELLLTAAFRLIRHIETHMDSSAELLGQVRRELRTLLGRLGDGPPAEQPNIEHALAGDKATSELTKESVDILRKSLQDRLPQLVPSVNQKLQHDYLKEAGGLLAVLLQPSPPPKHFLEVLRSAARKAVIDAMKETQIDQVIGDSKLASVDAVSWLESQLAAAKPRALDYGGATRTLVGIPERSRAESIASLVEHVDEKPTIAACTCGDLVVCYEVAQVPLANIAFALLEEQPICASYVSRLRSRIDVDWSQLTELT